MPRITITKRHVKINKVHQTLITTLFLDRVTSFLNTKIFCTTSNSKPATLLSGMTVSRFNLYKRPFVLSMKTI